MNATYRLQLGPELDFDRAREVVDYLRRLGVSHLYLSPITEACAGSTHGYDVTDHNRIREELGGEEGFERLRRDCVEAGLGLVLDFVPNHSGVGPDNDGWQDLLAHGPASPHARRFDLDWTPFKPELLGKLLLPFLGRPYGEALDAGELALVWERGRISCAYFDDRFALRPESYAEILEEAGLGDAEIGRAYRELIPGARDAAKELGRRLAEEGAGERLAAACARIGGARLHEILERQYWRLSYWKTAGYEVNYRRFFDINGLVALRMEDAQVFSDTHRLLADLLGREGVDGVRIDHVDGLFDPHGYLERLSGIAPRIWVEKILGHGEVPPEAWPIAGTTGYEFLNDVLHLLVHPGGEILIDRTYRRTVGEEKSYDDVLYRARHVVIATRLAGELVRLAYELDRLSEADYRTRDFTLEALREALAEVVACFPRYRTYLPHQPEQAREVIAQAVYEARRRNPAFEPSAFDFVGRVLLEPVRDDLEPIRAAWVARLQQYTAPVAAKGEEDTAFYRYPRFLALNEVGGKPDLFGIAPEVFHARARFRALRYPETLLATATHDHKQGEDTRMRLAALSELAEAWAKTARALRPALRRHRGDHGPAPSDAYRFLQLACALLDSAPEERLRDRLAGYLIKAAREAKVHTSWIAPREEYEADIERFVAGMLADRRVRRALAPIAGRAARLGFHNSIAQLVLKLGSPGVPDLYQGAELLDLSLVDPDNRRPVDFSFRRWLLDEIEPVLEAPELERLLAWEQAVDPRLKLFVTARLLRFRAAHPGPFAGSYREIEIEGDTADSWIAFEREGGGERVVVAVSRFVGTTGDDALRAGRLVLDRAARLVDVLSGVEVAAGADGRISCAALPLRFALLREA